MSKSQTVRTAILGLASATVLSACNVVLPIEDPYLLYRELMPRSILVFPPVNESVDINAPYSWVTTASKPIAEQGYYVFPVAVIDEFMKENGLPNPEDMHSAPLKKISEIFGADAVMYVTLEDFGQKFELLSSTTRVDARAEMVDVKTGQVIWNGALNYEESSDSGGLGLLGALVNAAITQIGDSIKDSSHDAAFVANKQLFGNEEYGLLLGPLHPGYADAVEAARIAAEEAAALRAAVEAEPAE
ncbi:MAG: DUF799 domain-containing protein [Granulosicoccus sp.]